MAGGIIVLRKAGLDHTGFDDYIGHILKKAAYKCWGIAFAEKGKMQINPVNKVPELDVVLDALKAIGDNQTLLHFGLYPQTYSEHDVQPFPLLCEDDDLEKPLICAALSGEWMATPGSSHLDVWDNAYQYLMDKLSSNYELCGKDLNKLIQSIQTDSFKADVAARIKSNGTIAFLTSTGEAWSTMKDIKVASKPDDGWWTNNLLGWRPPTVADDNASERTPASDATPKKGGFSERLAQLRGKITGAVAEVVTKKPEEESGPERQLIPQSIWGKGSAKDVLNWCNDYCGYVPEQIQQWRDGKLKKADIDFAKLYVVTKSARKEFQNSGKSMTPEPTGVVHKVDTTKASVPVASGKPLTAAEKLAAMRAKKAAAAAPVAEPVAEPAPEGDVETVKPGGPVKEFVPVPDVDTRTGVEALLIQSMEDGGKKIPDPKKVKTTEFASFSEIFGIPLDEVNLDKEALWAMVQDHPVAATMLLMEYQKELRSIFAAEGGEELARKTA